MKLFTSITEIIIFSLLILITINLSSCSEIKDSLTTVKKEKLSAEEEEIKAMENADIKATFVGQAQFYESANETRQITEVPEEPEEPPLGELVDFPETYDPFAIIWSNPEGGFYFDITIDYTFSYDKNGGTYINLINKRRTYVNGVDSVYFHPKQKRWGGKIPKWFKIFVNVRGLGGKERTYYINTLKQKKDAYIVVTGAWLPSHDVIYADILDGDCTKPEDWQKTQDEANEQKTAKAEAELKEEQRIKESREKELSTLSAKERLAKEKEFKAEDEAKAKAKLETENLIKSHGYDELEHEQFSAIEKNNMSNNAWNDCLKIEFNKHVYSDEKYNGKSRPGEKTATPISDEKESPLSRLPYNI